MANLQGKVALITGASKGIGRSTAVRLAKSGAGLVLGAKSRDLLEALGKELEGMGVSAFPVTCDVSSRVDCHNLVQQTLERFGRIDVLVNNAGVGYSGTIVDSEPQEVERMLAVNLLGLYYMTRSVLPHMIERKGGDIVNLGSVAGVKYSPNFAIYSATKFAVRAFSEALRNEVQEHNIRVTLIHPGMTRTPFFDSFTKGGSPVPLDKGDVLKPEDIAEAIHFALTRPEGCALNELTIRPTWQER
jgi:NADP-dependent 3-hydroxy acid dehydrogenase YdfG